MANKSSVEEQVAQLTEEEKDQILRAGKIATIIGSIIIALMVVWTFLGIYLIVNPPFGVEIDYIQMGLGIIGGGVIGMAALVVMAIIIKGKYPFYSDKKLSYIKKLNK